MSGQPVTRVDNSAFHPGPGALTAPPFQGRLQINPTQMQFAPELANSGVGGRDARLFPGSHLDFLRWRTFWFRSSAGRWWERVRCSAIGA